MMDLLSEYEKMIKVEPETFPFSLECELIDELTLYTVLEHQDTRTTEVRGEKEIRVTCGRIPLFERKIRAVVNVSYENIYRMGQDKIMETYIIPTIDDQIHSKLDDLITELRRTGYEVPDYRVGANGYLTRVRKDDELSEDLGEYSYYGSDNGPDI